MQREPGGWPVVMLVHRLGLFFIAQAIVAGVFVWQGEPSPWEASAAWWPVTGIVVNVISFALIRFLARREGRTWRDVIGADFRKVYVRADVVSALVAFVLSAPIAMLPNLGLASLLFGSPEAALDMFIRPLPGWIALVCVVLTPITLGLAELPTYFAYVMPRLANRWSNPTKAVLVAGFFLAAQHMAIPFLPDVRFIVWRLGMFVPFALFVGFVLQRRPRLLPYFMILHAIIDIPMLWMVWEATM